MGERVAGFIVVSQTGQFLEFLPGTGEREAELAETAFRDDLGNGYVIMVPCVQYWKKTESIQ